MTKEEMVQKILGATIYVGADDFDDLAIVTAVDIFDQLIYSNTNLGDGTAGEIHIKYPDNEQPEVHGIHIGKGDDLEEDAYICTRRLDYTGGEREMSSKRFLCQKC